MLGLYAEVYSWYGIGKNIPLTGILQTKDLDEYFHYWMDPGGNLFGIKLKESDDGIRRGYVKACNYSGRISFLNTTTSESVDAVLVGGRILQWFLKT